jgi:hypothetical protein
MIYQDRLGTRHKKYKLKKKDVAFLFSTLQAAGTDGRVPPRGTPRPESAGLVAGSPEADWSHFKANVSRDNETWYNVNVWLQRGMAELGDALLKKPLTSVAGSGGFSDNDDDDDLILGGQQHDHNSITAARSQLGQQLRGNASLFAKQIAASVAASLVPANASGFIHPPFLPPYARARGEFPVFRNMTEKVRRT